MIKVKKVEQGQKTARSSYVKHFCNFKGKSMVMIGGNFYNGGFLISKSKIAAILSLSNELKDFVDGKYDQDIKQLKEDEVIVQE